MKKKASTKNQSKKAFPVAERLHAAAIHLLRRVRVEDRQSGLSAARLSALSVAVYAGPISIGALADAEQVRAPTMSRLVDALVEQVLVARQADPNDSRVTLIVATPKGRDMLEEGRLRRVDALAAELSGLSEEELAVLDDGSQLLSRLFGGARKPNSEK